MAIALRASSSSTSVRCIAGTGTFGLVPSVGGQTDVVIAHLLADISSIREVFKRVLLLGLGGCPPLRLPGLHSLELCYLLSLVHVRLGAKVDDNHGW